jgi:hypothetical protein
MIGRPVQPAQERFWRKVNRTGPEPLTRPELGPCWLWAGYIGTRGYGMFKLASIGPTTAHRCAYEFGVGPIPDGYEIDHLCRVPACVNPAHLEAVTHLENMRRGVVAQRTHCPHGHEYTAENTARRNGRRFCRACERGRRRGRPSSARTQARQPITPRPRTPQPSADSWVHPAIRRAAGREAAVRRYEAEKLEAS